MHRLAECQHAVRDAIPSLSFEGLLGIVDADGQPTVGKSYACRSANRGGTN
jgi:hypothetical protein